MRAAFLVLAASFAVAASAASPRAGETILGGCRQGGCYWLKVMVVAPSRRFPQGVLKGLRVRRGSSIHRGGGLPSNPRGARIEWSRETQSVYAFCSTQRPGYAFETDGEPLVHFLDPFDLAGYQYSSAAMYMRICHGLTRMPSARTMRRLGYRPGTRNEQVENGSVATLTGF